MAICGLIISIDLTASWALIVYTPLTGKIAISGDNHSISGIISVSQA
jgi:hypothetical protein